MVSVGSGVLIIRFLGTSLNATAHSSSARIAATVAVTDAPTLLMANYYWLGKLSR
jgi:hypothetical protein